VIALTMDGDFSSFRYNPAAMGQRPLCSDLARELPLCVANGARYRHLAMTHHERNCSRIGPLRTSSHDDIHGSGQPLGIKSKIVGFRMRESIEMTIACCIVAVRISTH